MEFRGPRALSYPAQQVPARWASVVLYSDAIVDAGVEDLRPHAGGTEPVKRQTLMLDMYQRIIDGVVDLGFPLSVHFEASYGVSAPAFETFAAMLDYWSPG